MSCRRGQSAAASALLACALLAACGDDDAPEPERARGRDASAYDAASAQHAARPAFCARPGEDVVRDVFCGDAPAQLADLADLQRLLDIRFSVPNGAEPDGMLSVAQFSGHSTALSGHLVSPINPRVFLAGTNVVMAFQRGVQRVELAALGRDERRFRFYLVTFRQACNEARRGCGPGDLYTPRLERDWQSFAIEDDEDLANTAADCRQCHQRGLDKPVLLMRELQPPWTHFFIGRRTAQALKQVPPGDPTELTGLALDYQLARGDEPYANVPATAFYNTQPGLLQLLVGSQQPLLFDSVTIARERGVNGPERSSTRSPTWDAAYAAFKRGANLALPYFADRATDPDKQAALTAAYQRYLRGELDPSELPDLADVFPDDPQTRAEIGLQTEPGATPAEALVQACGSCHNDVLDQTLTRARFNIALDRMSRAQLDRAIERIERAPDAAGVMPPPEARQLDPAARMALIAYLQRGTPAAAELQLLQSAAQLGMAGTTP